MSIISVEELFDTQRTAAVNDQYVRTYERVFQVMTDGTDGGIAVREAAGVPQLYTYYAFAIGTGAAESDTLALCREVRAENQSDSPKHWRVYCSYDSTYNPAGNDDDNPLNQPAIVSFSSVTYEIEARKDVSGHVIANKAGDPFDPLPMFDRARCLIKVQKNLALSSFNAALVVAVTNRVNTSSFLGVGAGNLKCQQVNAAPQEQQGLYFYSAEFEFLYDENDWNPTAILNAGYRERKAGATTSTPITDPKQNAPINIPWPLDVLGKALPDPTTGLTYCNFTMYLTYDFNGLGIYP